MFENCAHLWGVFIGEKKKCRIFSPGWQKPKKAWLFVNYCLLLLKTTIMPKQYEIQWQSVPNPKFCYTRIMQYRSYVQDIVHKLLNVAQKNPPLETKRHCPKRLPSLISEIEVTLRQLLELNKKASGIKIK